MLHKLSQAAVKNQKKPGRYNDGGGLYLRVTKKLTKSWVFRYRNRSTGRQRDMGLGSYPDVGLKKARESAERQRKLLHDYLDPIEEDRLRRLNHQTQKGEVPNFDACAASYIEAQEPGWSNPKHVAQWRSTLETYASPVIGDLPVNEVNANLVLEILNPIWTTKTETACRVRGRIESILDWAASPTREYRAGENPARWRGLLDKELAPPSKVKNVTHFAALPYAELPSFMAELQRLETGAARCLEFTILTATRTGESIGAEWSEIEVNTRTWNLPAERMKGNHKHRVPLSDVASGILTGQNGQDDIYVFPGAREGKHLSNGAMLGLLRGLEKDFTVHGFRSTFADWCADVADVPLEVAEVALAHQNRDKTQRAYFRTDHFEKRRDLMSNWAAYCYYSPANYASDDEDSDIYVV